MTKWIFIIILLFLSCSNTKSEPTEISFNTKHETQAPDSNQFQILEKEVIIGDFDGDGTIESLQETFISLLDSSSIPKYYFETQETFEKKQKEIYDLKPNLTLSSSNPKIEELLLSKHKRILGTAWLKNEGDLNNDGNDEISVVIDWADWSSVNHCMIYTFKDEKWNELLKFQIHDWEFIENNFNGFIINLGNGKIVVKTFDEDINRIEKEIDLN